MARRLATGFDWSFAPALLVDWLAGVAVSWQSYTLSGFFSYQIDLAAADSWRQVLGEKKMDICILIKVSDPKSDHLTSITSVEAMFSAKNLKFFRMQRKLFLFRGKILRW